MYENEKSYHEYFMLLYTFIALSLEHHSCRYKNETIWKEEREDFFIPWINSKSERVLMSKLDRGRTRNPLASEPPQLFSLHSSKCSRDRAHTRYKTFAMALEPIGCSPASPRTFALSIPSLYGSTIVRSRMRC